MRVTRHAPLSHWLAEVVIGIFSLHRFAHSGYLWASYDALQETDLSLYNIH